MAGVRRGSFDAGADVILMDAIGANESFVPSDARQSNCFCWLFGVRNARVHLLMTSALTILIVSMLVLVFELQYPFRADVGIGPDAWVGVIEHIRLMQGGNQMNMRM